MVIQERLYTAADLWELSHSPEYSEQRLELSEGVLIIMAPAGIQHGNFAMKLGHRTQLSWSYMIWGSLLPLKRVTSSILIRTAKIPCVRLMLGLLNATTIYSRFAMSLGATVYPR